MLPGVLLSLLVGPVVAVPAPDLVPLLETVNVTHSDEGKSGFQLVFRLERPAELPVPDYLPLATLRLKVGMRLILVVTINAVPQVLMDGIIINQQLAPGDKPNTAMLTVTGEDLSCLLALTDVQMPQVETDALFVTRLLAPFAAYGIVPMVLPAPTDLPSDPNAGPSHPRGKPLNMIQEKAREHDYVFFIYPGPVPGMNVAYYGPRFQVPIPQRALTMNMGAATNVTNLSFQHDGNAPSIVMGLVKDTSMYASTPALPVIGIPFDVLPLAVLPSTFGNAPYITTKFLEPNNAPSWARAQRQALSEANASARRAVTASGEVDGAKYGMVLYARALVGVRGAGYSFDGLYYVKSVSHSIKRGEYKQSFSLQREGLGSTLPVVPP